jgi:cytosolic carboxypeptidase protein 2/3
MQNDINSTGYTQWFYFRVMNTFSGDTVKFNILNYTKPDSLFNYGMKVAVYSEKRAD